MNDRDLCKGHAMPNIREISKFGHELNALHHEMILLAAPTGTWNLC